MIIVSSCHLWVLGLLQKLFDAPKMDLRDFVKKKCGNCRFLFLKASDLTLIGFDTEKENLVTFLDEP